MARTTEGAVRYLFELDRCLVNQLAGFLVLRIELDLVIVLIGNGSRDPFAGKATVHRLRRIAGLDTSFAVNASISFLHAMACNAGDTFANDLWRVGIGTVAWKVQLSCNRCVTTNAECAIVPLASVLIFCSNF